MPDNRQERRADRSDVLARALDKLLVASAMKHEPLTAVVADTQGLLVASGARDDDSAERIAGVAAVLAALGRTLKDHKVLNGLKSAVLEAPNGEHLALWSFEVDGDPLLLGLLLRDAPSEDLAQHLIDGVKRIFETLHWKG
jgi:predicted regulator of Ras-like GTPase activity (Roadblock/LC7/MglB family)